MEKLTFVEYTPDKGDIEIAKELMCLIQLDNGCINRQEKENYPEKWLKKISKSAGYFFYLYPEFLGDTAIEELAGDIEGPDFIDKYGFCEGIAELMEDLDEYFNNL